MKSEFILSLLMLMVFTSCAYNDDTGNNGPQITAEEAINNAVFSLSYYEGDAGRLSGIWLGQFSNGERSVLPFPIEFIDADRFDPIWSNMYNDGYTSAIIALEAAMQEDQLEEGGVAKILQAHYAAETALLFGDVPFSQAANPLEFTDPAYDAQADVLEGAISLLEEGIVAVGSTSITEFNGVFNGFASWRQFALALIARYQLALGNFPEAIAAAEDAAIDSREFEIAFRHDSLDGSFNRYHAFTVRERAGLLTMNDNFLTNVLAATGELSRADDKTDDAARLAHFQDTTDFVGMLNATNMGYFAADADYALVSVPEMQLIIAEAAARTGAIDKAIEALNDARNYWDEILGTNNYQDYVVGDEAIANDNLLETILLEKYLSVFGLPTLYDMGRTNNLIGATIEINDELPQRFLYPESESLQNTNFPGQHRIFDPTPINQ